MVKKDVAKAVASYKWLARIESQVDAQEKVLSVRKMYYRFHGLI